jgi:hypothetical protein
MNYTIYDQNSGQIQYVFASQDSELISQNLQGKAAILGEYNSRDYYVQDGAIVNKPSEPNEPGLVYEFDYTTKSWQINVSKSTTAARSLRDHQLTLVDRINPVWYNSLTQEQQAELAAYRLALLAVPQQSGFPTQVEWPAKPTWI